MAKLFCVSDIHGFYEEFVMALNKAGFDRDNPDHYVVTLGDHFDRGHYPLAVMRFLKCLPRKILIRGNHEQLLEECCDRGYAESHDYSNGTFGTICELGDAGEGWDFGECCMRTMVKTHLFLDSMVNYLETDKYIFVHSWIPTINKDGLPAYYIRNRQFEYNPNWRDASQKEWDDAMWGNPWDMAAQGLNQTNKTIVFGHWSTNEAWAEAENRNAYGADAKFDPYYGDGFIAIDACTAQSRQCNVVVLEDELFREIY